MPGRAEGYRTCKLAKGRPSARHPPLEWQLDPHLISSYARRTSARDPLYRRHVIGKSGAFARARVASPREEDLHGPGAKQINLE